MAGLFQPPNNRRSFGGIVNPFIANTPAPPPPPATPPPDPDAWRAAQGPNPFNPVNRWRPNPNPILGRQPEPEPQPRPTPPRVPQVIWGHPDFQPNYLPRQAPYRADVPYNTFQSLLLLAGHVRAAGLALLTSLAAHLARLLAALLLVLSRLAVYGLIVWWLGSVFLRVSASFFRRAAEVFLGWTWKTPAGAYGLKREYTSWSVSSVRAAGVVAAAASPGSGAPLRTTGW